MSQEMLAHSDAQSLEPTTKPGFVQGSSATSSGQEHPGALAPGLPSGNAPLQPGKWSCLKLIQVFSCLVPTPHLPSTRS